MPKKQKEKTKISISLDIGLFHTIRKKASLNGRCVSQEIERNLVLSYGSERSYLEQELKLAVDNLNVLKYKISKYNSDQDLKKLIMKFGGTKLWAAKNTR